MPLKKSDKARVAKVEERIASALEELVKARSAKSNEDTNRHLNEAEEFLDSAMSAMAEVEGHDE